MGTKPNKRAPIKPVEKQYDIILGTKGDTFTYIPVQKVDSFFKLPVYLKDKTGKLLQSTAYDVVFSEWGLFEDSTGREKVMTEYYSMTVMGDTIPEFFRRNIASENGTVSHHKVLIEK